jgi:hypothetical protein
LIPAGLRVLLCDDRDERVRNEKKAKELKGKNGHTERRVGVAEASRGDAVHHSQPMIARKGCYVNTFYCVVLIRMGLGVLLQDSEEVARVVRDVGGPSAESAVSVHGLDPFG